MTQSIAATLQTATQLLQQAAGNSARLEAEMLLCQVLNKNRSHLYAWSDTPLTKQEKERFGALLEQRTSGKPLAYILGRKEFWSFTLKVTPATLIPRPETETLVEMALQFIPEKSTTTVADLGTGSGAIALAIASERPLTTVIATDLSEQALLIAKENARSLGIQNIHFYQGSWLQPLLKRPPIDLIISNPPYVADGDPHLKLDGLPWEPLQALTSGPDGLNDIRTLIQEAKSHLKPGARLILEHGYNQASAIRDLFRLAGYREAITQRDLEQRDRISMGEIPPAD